MQKVDEFNMPMTKDQAAATITAAQRRLYGDVVGKSIDDQRRSMAIFDRFVSDVRKNNQCSCLENPRDGGAWWAAIYGVTQSRTRLKQLSSSSSSSSSMRLIIFCPHMLENTNTLYDVCFILH